MVCVFSPATSSQVYLLIRSVGSLALQEVVVSLMILHDAHAVLVSGGSGTAPVLQWQGQTAGVLVARAIVPLAGGGVTVLVSVILGVPGGHCVQTRVISLCLRESVTLTLVSQNYCGIN